MKYLLFVWPHREYEDISLRQLTKIQDAIWWAAYHFIFKEFTKGMIIFGFIQQVNIKLGLRTGERYVSYVKGTI